MSRQHIMKRLRDIREKMSLDIVGMDLKELNAYLKAKGAISEKKTGRTKRTRSVKRTGKTRGRASAKA